MAYLLTNSSFNMLCNGQTLSEFLQAQDDSGTLVHVVPTGRQVRLLLREKVRRDYAALGKPIETPLIMTLEGFIKRCFDFANPQFDRSRLVSESYRLALIEEAAETSELRFFAKSDKTLSPATLERLANVIFGLKEDGITPENLYDDIDSAGEFSDLDLPRMRDIHSLYNQYELLLGDYYFDKTDILAELLTLNRDNFLKNQPIKNVVYCEGFSEFKLPEVHFFELFAQSETPVAIMMDYSDQNGPLFGNLKETQEKLINAGFRFQIIDSIPQLSEKTPPHERPFTPLAAYLRRWLFNTELQITHTGFSKSFSVLATETRAEEVRTIAKLIRHLNLQKNIPLSEICIAIRQPELYSGLLREMFTAYSIPANITDRFPLAKSPIAIAVFALLDIVVRGFRREDIHRALQSPYLQLTREENGKTIPLDAANLYSVALKLRISGERYFGKLGWQRRLDEVMTKYYTRLRTLENDNYTDETELQILKKDLESIRKASLDFTALCDVLPATQKLLTPEEFFEIISKNIIGNLKIRENILTFYDHIKQYAETKYSEFLRLAEEVEKDARSLTELITITEEMTVIDKRRNPKITRSLSDYVQRLRTSTLAAKYQVREKSKYGVTVTSLEQTRGIPFRVTIVCGLIDGEFPQVYTPETFLGKELPDSEERFIKAERMLFYQTITNNPNALETDNKLVYLTYPQQKDGQENVRSPFVDALLKVTSLEYDARVFDIPSLSRSAKNDELTDSQALQWKELEWLDAVCSKEEALLYYSTTNESVLSESTAQLGIEETLQFIDNTRSLSPELSANGLQSSQLTEEERHNLTKRQTEAFSISEIEEYAACPYKYFTEKVLRINEKRTVDSWLSPLEKGTLFHQVLYRFYHELQQQLRHELDNQNDVQPVKLNPELRQLYKEHLFRIANEEIGLLEFNHPFFELEKEDLLGAGAKIGKLERWLDAECERIESGWEFAPAFFEYAFGMKSKYGNPRPAVKVSEGLSIRGKIDRIELSEQEDGWKFIIADYKTGNHATNADVKNGESFQMPMYLETARTLLKEEGIDATPEAAVYYLLNPKFDKKKKKYETQAFQLLPAESSLRGDLKPNSTSQLVENAEMRDDIIRQTIARAETITANIADGNFPVNPLSTACTYCSYKPICRIKELEE
ncbi:MAG: exodeoxyribonuclease V subunit gamma [Bacteroidetes bacterium]|nr:exodeoxyribonuclease V subunit gamma [Bacteroidota bacterium]